MLIPAVQPNILIAVKEAMAVGTTLVDDLQHSKDLGLQASGLAQEPAPHRQSESCTFAHSPPKSCAPWFRA